MLIVDIRPLVESIYNLSMNFGNLSIIYRCFRKISRFVSAHPGESTDNRPMFWGNRPICVRESPRIVRDFGTPGSVILGSAAQAHVLSLYQKGASA